MTKFNILGLIFIGLVAWDVLTNIEDDKENKILTIHVDFYDVFTMICGLILLLR